MLPWAAIAFNGEIERIFALPELDLPDVSRHREPERAAEALRWKWRLEERPIVSIVELLESKGVRVYSLPADAAEVETFSMWHRDQPFVLLNIAKRADELRFDLARELGHLLLHRHGAPAYRKAQQAASVFASALLTPAAAMREEVPSLLEMNQLTALSRNWGGPPPAALAQWLHKLTLLSGWQYRKLSDHIAEQPAVREEGRDVAREKSQLLQRVFASLRARGMTRHTIASTVHIYPKDLDELVFGLAPDASGDAETFSNVLRPRLTSVSSNT